MNTKYLVLTRLTILGIFIFALASAHPANADYLDQRVPSTVIGVDSSSWVPQRLSWNPFSSLNSESPNAPEASHFTIDDVSLTEGNSGTTNLTFTVTLTPAESVDVSVDYASADNTATQPGDYTSTSGTLNFLIGETTHTIDIPIVGDTLDETNETFYVNLSNPTGGTTINDSQGVGTINDDDAQPTVSFTTTSQSLDEGGGTMTVIAQLNVVSGLTVSVPFTVTGTATNGTDYTITGSPVTIPAGNTSTNITISVTNDTLDENNETVIVTMGSPTNATQGATTVHTATILDNDNPPVVSFTSASQSQLESIGTMTVTATLNVTSGLPVTVPFTPSGTATVNTDYTITASPVTIPAGSTTANIVITVTNDALPESNETVIVTMLTPTNATLGSPSVHTATILDNDAQVTVSFTSASQSASEGIGSMIITAQLSGVSGLDVTVPFTVTGTATNGTDFTITGSPITILAGNTSNTITITVIEDALSEGNETVVVTMGAPTNASPGAITVHTATILDNDAQPTVTFTSASQSQDEGIGTMVITAQLSAISGGDVSVPFTVTGTASNGTDFTITASPVIITAGSLSNTITISVINDTLDENNETVIVTMGTPTNATLGLITVHTATILDNDATPTVSFTSASQSALENVPTMTITAQLNVISGIDVTIPFTVTGTATGGTDYTITASPVTILAGSLSTNITISVTNDTLSESNETVIVTMGTPTNATPIGITVHTATILDNDVLPSVSFTTASQSSSEEIPTMNITAQLSVLSGLPVTVPFTVTGTATGGTDYTITTSPVIIPAGSLNTNIVITVINDSLDEINETVVVTMGAPVNATPGSTTVHTATIVDNDISDATVDPTTLLTVEKGVPATFTFKLNAQPSQPVTIGLSSGDLTEGTVSPASLTFTSADWNTAKTVTVTPVDDFKPDGAVIYNIVTAAAVSTDPNYSGYNAPDVSVTNADNDTPGVTVSPLTDLTTSEGKLADTIQILLNTEPDNNVEITLLSLDQSEGKFQNPDDPGGSLIGQLTITFTTSNWDAIHEVFLVGVDDLVKDGDIPYEIKVTSVSTDPLYNNIPFPNLAAINENAPSIEWVLPVGDNGTYYVDNLVPIRLRVRSISPEPIGYVRFRRYKPGTGWITIGEDNQAPYESFLNPADLLIEWNQVNAYAFDPAGDTWSIQKIIYIYRRGTKWRVYLPIILNQP